MQTELTAQGVTLMENVLQEQQENNFSEELIEIQNQVKEKEELLE